MGVVGRWMAEDAAVAAVGGVLVEQLALNQLIERVQPLENLVATHNWHCCCSMQPVAAYHRVVELILQLARRLHQVYVS